MNKMRKTISSVTAVFSLAVLFSACQKDPNSAGYEYMPDMYRSPAVEAYVDYGMDPFHFGDSAAVAAREAISARKPVEGTIKFVENPEKVNLFMPYAIPNTPEGYEASAALKNPLMIDEASLERGKEIYDRFCQHCHGKKGKADGKVITVGNHPAPGAYDAALKDLPEGKIFHSITYGKGVMGQHASQINKEDRWKLVAYVQTLQGKTFGEEEAAEDAADAEAETVSETEGE